MSSYRKARMDPEQQIAADETGLPPSGGFGWRAWMLVLGVACVLGNPGQAYSAGPVSSASKPGTGQDPFVICDQKYALCAAAQCFTLNGLAYCKCDVLTGESISVPFEFGDPPQDVCTLLDEGLSNGYTVSTFSLPEQITKEYTAAYQLGGGPPPLALYTCAGGSSTGPYAQCDGGVCFESTAGNEFPGVGALGEKQIICSCPITDPRKILPQRGYQIAGPWALDDGTGSACGADGTSADCCSTSWYDQFCGADYGSKPIPTGATIPVGAPRGVPLALSTLLGDVQPFNSCDFPKRAHGKH